MQKEDLHGFYCQPIHVEGAEKCSVDVKLTRGRYRKGGGPEGREKEGPGKWAGIQHFSIYDLVG